MDKTIKQLIRETNANGVKDVVWDEKKKKWVISYLGRGLNPNEFKTFLEVVKSLQPEPGH